MDVLIEDSRDGWLVGRSHRDAPEIDGMVFVQGEAEVGNIVRTRVTGAEEYDLYAELLRMPVTTGKKLMPLRQVMPARPL